MPEIIHPPQPPRVVLSESQARQDHSEFLRMRQKAQEHRVDLEILPDTEFDQLVYNIEPPKPVPQKDSAGLLEVDGVKVLPITRSKATNHVVFLQYRGVARDLGVPLHIVDDDYFEQGDTA